MPGSLTHRAPAYGIAAAGGFVDGYLNQKDFDARRMSHQPGGSILRERSTMWRASLLVSAFAIDRFTNAPPVIAPGLAVTGAFLLSSRIAREVSDSVQHKAYR